MSTVSVSSQSAPREYLHAKMSRDVYLTELTRVYRASIWGYEVYSPNKLRKRLDLQLNLV